MEAKDRIIVPVDTNNIDVALKIVETLQPYVGMFKFGLELQNSIIAQLINYGDLSSLGKIKRLFNLVDGKLFWDGKWDDISNTVKGAANAISLLKPAMVNVHVSAGEEAIKAAIENSPDSIVLGVTVLTSISSEECYRLFGEYSGYKVNYFAQILARLGAGGIICSPKELPRLNKPKFKGLLKVVPGIRPLWADANDQKRIMTPREAIDAGGDYLVIGRPITSPPNGMTPQDAVEKIIEELEA
ncbi:MAG: orotidine-5'-phosphate decarboxylase [Candidatus Shapirobacteria bacterium]|nr:orotidine-5'-phosphate decarboxylase [Candidatus Shapirobacteria bacterium]MDD3002387.1 orotidine-5'-phosphate decarboxylase [Candidatus Shapirobacteria bacterium]MDD4383305.1 orotidine-5'-phosphate decarboxylase [Candidatus Shapirobacteria bacterium]